jgi:hypothetical protein
MLVCPVHAVLSGYVHAFISGSIAVEWMVFNTDGGYDVAGGCGLHFGMASAQPVPVVHGPSLGGIPTAPHRDRLLLRPLACYGPHGI